MTSDRGLGDGASPVRDDRTWTLLVCDCCGWLQGARGMATKFCAGAHATGTAHELRAMQSVEVVPRSELARVQDALDVMERAHATVMQVADSLAGQLEATEQALDQAREALKGIARLQSKWDAPTTSTDWKASDMAWAAVGSEAHKIAVDCLAASGVTEKGDGTDG